MFTAMLPAGAALAHPLLQRQLPVGCSVDVEANHDPDSKDSVHSTHHDRPLVILNGAQPGQSIRSAQAPEFARPGRVLMKHTDEELALIEALVGRTPAFAFQ